MASRRRGTGVCWFAVALILALPSRAHAHDPFESWTSATLRSDTFELIVTMAQSTALKLIDPEAKIPVLTFENFASHRPRLEREAASLYVVTSGRKRIAPNKVTADLTDENDVVFKVRYARPAPGPLHFHAAFLKKLGQGYGGILEASDNQGNHLGWEQLMFENPNVEITIPAPPAAPKTP
jgi:hypothetical protein